MHRLTEGDEQGNWMLKGVAWKSLHTGQVITKEVSERLYGALCKLRDYEESGLNPDEVEATVELLDAKPPERCQIPKGVVAHIRQLKGGDASGESTSGDVQE